jgi:hypothetical protein
MVAVILVSGVGSFVDYRKEIRFVEKRNASNAVKRVSIQIKIAPTDILTRQFGKNSNQARQVRNEFYFKPESWPVSCFICPNEFKSPLLRSSLSSQFLNFIPFSGERYPQWIKARAHASQEAPRRRYRSDHLRYVHPR